MSDIQPPDKDFRFLFDGREPLSWDYNERTDVLELWRGEQPVAAYSVPTEDGHLVRFSIDSGEVVGFTIFEWSARWSSHESISLRFPASGDREDSSDDEVEEHLLLYA
jgi:hypothetical protein